jgi:hypothetical protein
LRFLATAISSSSWGSKTRLVIPGANHAFKGGIQSKSNSSDQKVGLMP